MKSISLTRGKAAIVDDDDFDWLTQWKWRADTGANTFYAARTTRLESGKRTTQEMHRAIMEHHGHALDGLEVDHRNHDGLDNRKENLRAGTQAENMGNLTYHDEMFIGVRLVRDRWQSRIAADGKMNHIGYFDTALEAALSRDQYIIDNGLTGYPLNFPQVFRRSA